MTRRTAAVGSATTRVLAGLALWIATCPLTISAGAAEAPPGPATAADRDAEIRALRAEVQELRRRDEEQRRRLEELESRMQRLAGSGAPSPAGEAAAPAAESPSAASALDAALADSGAATVASPSVAAPAASGDLAAVPIAGGTAQARLIDLSVSTLVAGGGSSVGNEALSALQAGAHDPDENGFTLQQAELSLTGAVDPYFSGEAHIVASLHGVELEEAFLTTTSLPFGLRLEAGYSLTEFGLHNPLHAHAWDWLDQPVIATRLFGGEGLRSPGLRADWLLPLPFFSELHVGVQNANEEEFTASFVGEEAIGGRPNRDRDVRSADDVLWLLRSNSSWDLTPDAALLVGASALFGPNATGPDAQTRIYGIDAKIRWRPEDNFRGWPFLLWQVEAMRRDYEAADFSAGSDVDPESGEFPNDLAGDTLHDQGFYTQLLYGFRYRWAAGARVEYATGEGPSIADGLPAPRREDSLRDDRLRVSPLLVFHPTEFSRLRLQYNYDDADHLHGGDAHTLWLGAEVLYGKHAAHKY